VIQNHWIPQTPTGQQAAFLTLPVREALFGGAAGGGKSSALLMAALQYVDVPGYAALLFRRTYADLRLPGALMDRAGSWLGGTAARWNANEHQWMFPSGATLTFGYLEAEADRYRYQGVEAQFIGWDELTQFSEVQYRYLFSRLRRLETANVPLRMRAASNPGGVGHEWVRQRFLIEGRSAGRVFVPARLADNPYLDVDEYRQSLAELDPTTRAQLEEGDWEVHQSGSKFRREWFEVVGEAPAGLRWVRYWDLAATEPKPGRDPDWTCGALMGERAGIYYIRDVRRVRTTPLGVEQLIRQTAELDGQAVDVWMEQEPGASGVGAIDNYARKVLIGFSFRGNKTTGSKEVRANPVSSAAQAGNVKLVRGPWIGSLLDEFESFPGGAHDDQVDAVSGALGMLQVQDEDFDSASANDRTRYTEYAGGRQRW
jgi:predicted phage terminase large subunit-like protein